MSSDFDFFAGQRTPAALVAPATPSAWAPAAASAWAPPAQPDQRFGSAVGEWQPMSTPPAGQFAPASRSSRRPFVIAAVVAVLAVIAGGAVYVSSRPHPVPLPAALAGLPKISLPSAQAHAVDSDKHGLGGDGVHDISIGFYFSSDSEPPAGLVVIAGRTASTAPNFSQLAQAVGQVGQAAGITVTPQTLTSGASRMECATISVQGRSTPLCAWQGSHAVLLGYGYMISVQDTADALEQARLHANLS